MIKMTKIRRVAVLLSDDDLITLKKKTGNNIGKDAIMIAVKYYLTHEVA